MNDHDRLLTFQEASDYLRCSRATVYRLIAERKLRAFKVGGNWRFRQDDLFAALEICEAPGSIIRSLERKLPAATGPEGGSRAPQLGAVSPASDQQEEGQSPEEGSGQVRWYLVKTRRNKERQVAAILTGWGIAVYLPLVHHHSGPDGGGDQPFLKGYLFARFDARTEAVLRVRSAPGVEYLMTMEDAPMVVPDGVIGELQALLEARDADSAAASLTGAVQPWLAEWGQMVELLWQVKRVLVR